MSGVNKVILVGNLGTAPELKHLQSGTVVCNFSMATSEKWTDKSGQKQERTEWHRIVCYGKSAETLTKYLNKGDKVYLEGKLQTRDWEDKDGKKRYVTEIIVTGFQFLPRSAKTQSGTIAEGEDHEPTFDQNEQFPDDGGL